MSSEERRQQLVGEEGRRRGPFPRPARYVADPVLAQERADASEQHFGSARDGVEVVPDGLDHAAAAPARAEAELHEEMGHVAGTF